ncbi:bacterial low temperature requirement A protein-domain-containing protein [Lipomyces tetrasporus]|uniref:Bacterial low temperature requirement A protein-domain-containing protein n=1 Tax=Lipomyces tetrasporus TaxID=54092 RepID=A0AAD7VUF6_9ASCO|nr:bacterial low temperature requirement A protein-domain-containing protein [Lipomyces tetrasporus]KAJ8101951.1 bacterial low temperature requirement A protein-domain-containing protein [Lipomyces tetrasporus]
MTAITAIDCSEIKPNPRSLFRQPLALQWIEDGKLMKRSEGERQAGRFELFLDLLYVAILANFAENLAEHVSGVNLVKYILILAPTWHVWSDLRELMNSFYTDDLAQRVLILWIMALLVMYGNNAVLVDEDISAMRTTVGVYMVARLSTTTTHLLYSFSSYHHRAQQRLWFWFTVVGLSIYIPLFVESISLRSKIAVASVGIIFEECAWVFCYSPASKKFLGARYTTAVDIAHEVDRFAAFFIIVLGEFLYSIVVGSPAAIGFNDRLLRAIWTLIIAFCLNWLYVHNDGAVKGVHPIRHNIYGAFLWFVLHLPLAASLLAGGHVSAISAKSSELHDGELWLLCGGLGAGMILLYLIALLYKSEDEPGTLILPKSARLILRPVSGIIIICLPLAHDLDSTSIVSIIMALSVLCVVWESVTSLVRGAKLWEKWENRKYPEVSVTLQNMSSEE